LSEKQELFEMNLNKENKRTANESLVHLNNANQGTCETEIPLLTNDHNCTI